MAQRQQAWKSTNNPLQTSKQTGLAKTQPERSKVSAGLGFNDLTLKSLGKFMLVPITCIFLPLPLAVLYNDDTAFKLLESFDSLPHGSRALQMPDLYRCLDNETSCCRNSCTPQWNGNMFSMLQNSHYTISSYLLNFVSAIANACTAEMAAGWKSRENLDPSALPNCIRYTRHSVFVLLKEWQLQVQHTPHMHSQGLMLAGTALWSGPCE